MDVPDDVEDGDKTVEIQSSRNITIRIFFLILSSKSFCIFFLQMKVLFLIFVVFFHLLRSEESSDTSDNDDGEDNPPPPKWEVDIDKVDFRFMKTGIVIKFCCIDS